LFNEKRTIPKNKTKGLFNVCLKTNAGNYLVDQDWQKRANHMYHSLEVEREETMMNHLIKKKE